MRPTTHALQIYCTSEVTLAQNVSRKRGLANFVFELRHFMNDLVLI